MYRVDPCITEWRLSTVGSCAGCALVELDGGRAHLGPCAVAALVELGERCTRVGPCAGCALVELDGGEHM